MDWDHILTDAVKDGQIRELYLSKVPVLKTANNWKNVELVGWVDHRMRYSHYKGGLVKINGKLYFVKEKTIDALREFMDWNFPQKIMVIPD